MADPPLIRVSERKAFRRCPQLWWWLYRMGLVGKGRPADALWFGTGVHMALADWYRPGYSRGPKPAQTFDRWVGGEITRVKTSREEHDQFAVPVYEDARELGLSMLNGYIKRYRDDDQAETLSVEQTFEIEIWRDSRVIAVLLGTFDGVYLDHEDGAFYLWEHKTASAIATAYLALDDQAGTYFAVATIVLRAQGVLGPGEEIAGVMYNFLRKTRPDGRPRDEAGHALNKDGSISKRQTAKSYVREPIERSPGEVNSQLQRLADEVALMNMMRTGKVAVYKNTTWECPRCPFFEMCQLHEKGNERSVRAYQKAAYIQVDPYLNYRKSAAE